MKIRIEVLEATADEYLQLGGVPAIGALPGGVGSHELIAGDLVEFELPPFVNYAVVHFGRGSFTRELAALGSQQIDRAQLEHALVLLRARADRRARLDREVSP